MKMNTQDFPQSKSEQAAQFLKSLANPHRLNILCLLVEREYCVNHLVENSGISQSAISQHLARMRAEGLVSCRRDAQKQYYSICDDKVFAIISTLKNQFCPLEQKDSD